MKYRISCVSTGINLNSLQKYMPNFKFIPASQARSIKQQKNVKNKILNCMLTYTSTMCQKRSYSKIYKNQDSGYLTRPTLQIFL